WNAGAARLFGWERPEVLGQPVSEVHRPTAAGSNGETIFQVVRDAGRWYGELQFVRRDGGAGACEAVAVPLVDSVGQKRGTLFVHVELPPAPAPAPSAEASAPVPVAEKIPPAVPAPLSSSRPDALLDPHLSDERFLLRKIIDAVPDPIFCKDSEGRYL